MSPVSITAERIRTPRVLPSDQSTHSDLVPLPVQVIPQRRLFLPELLPTRPVLLAPMEDVSDIPFRAICRDMGADLTYTEFINVDMLLRFQHDVSRKMDLAPGEHPIGIQIYGADPQRLADAARIAEVAGPTLIDINCGCWVPKVAKKGGGSAWLRDLPAMADMASRIVKAVSVPVTIKTRLGWGDEPGELPVYEMVRRLEQTGIAALTLHCRTVAQRHDGAANWDWAARAQQATHLPIILNGGIQSATDIPRAFAETGCAAVMIGKAAIGNPWIFAQARQALADQPVTMPSPRERFAIIRRHLDTAVDRHGERFGVISLRRHLPHYLLTLREGARLRQTMNTINNRDEFLAALDNFAASYD